MARKAAIILILIIVTVGVVGLAPLQRVRAAGQTWIVTSTMDSGPGTFRSCLANAVIGDTITFDSSVFPPTSPAFINLTSELPHITQGNLTIDASGAGVILNGSGTPADTVGLFVDSESNTIKGLQILDFPGWGIRLTANARACSISGNSITNNSYGIQLVDSANNTISGNKITNNDFGIWFDSSSNNTLRNNDLSNNEYNFGVSGSLLSHYMQDIDDSNTVDGKPVYYWVNRRDMAIPFDAGYIALVNCANITVQNLNLTNNGQGALLAYTTNSTITKNNITNSWRGIRLYSSSNNSIYENNITNNKDGVKLWYSSNNTISGNNITENNIMGIFLIGSSNDSITGNNITNNWLGINLSSGSDNTISGNNITNNEYGIWLHESSNNSVSGNNVTANTNWGIYLDYSSENTLTGNNITNNEYGIRIGWDSYWNSIYHNNFINNTQQAYIETSGYSNFWDNGVKGNYWSDYKDKHPNATEIDGIWDTPYVIDDYNQDNYPIVPEFPSFLILPLFMMATLLAVVVYRRKQF